MDPVAIEDEEVAVLKAEVLSVIKGLDSHINTVSYTHLSKELHEKSVYSIMIVQENKTEDHEF